MTWTCVAFSLMALPFCVVACGGQQGTLGGAKLGGGAGAKPLDHEECSESGNRVEVLDTNNDGKSDIRRVFDKGSGREKCRVTDLNHDGKPDMYEYYDGSGAVRRREYCYDDTGAVNAVEYFENGRLARREYDTGGLHKIDTWDWFDGSAPSDPKTGRPAHPVRRERDVTGDGKVDQWWTWSGDNVTIAIDTNGDGKPDPGSTITLGKDGQPIAATADHSPPGTAPAPSSSASPPAAPSPGTSGAPTATSSAPLAPVASGAMSHFGTDGGKLQ